MKGKIYKIQNTINSKVYIGQTTQTLKKRFSGHCCYSKTDRSVNMYIKRAIHKYGRENFSIELLEECPIEQMSEREKFWISYYDSYNSGYNLTLGGQDSNYFSLNRLENTIDIKKFVEYIKEFRPLAIEVARHFNISKYSVHNLIKRLEDPDLILNYYNPRKGKSIEDIDKLELLALYDAGHSIKELVKIYKIEKTKISKFLKESGRIIRRSYRKRI